MTGLDCLREELKKRGCTKAQIESKLVPIILDILTNSENKYEEMWKDEATATYQMMVASNKMAEIQHEISTKKWLIREYQEQVEEAKEHRLHCEDYIDKFNKSLYECETQEGRDTMRIAQMYVNSVDVNTKYDNTAYIIGLASILSKGKINAMDELMKINKKLPDIDSGEWRRI